MAVSSFPVRWFPRLSPPHPTVPTREFHPRLPLLLTLGLALATLAVLPPSARAEPHITEFLASNAAGLADADRHFVDWIELHNPDAAPADLTGWYLTDNAAQPTRWRFPSFTLQPGEYRVVFASGKDRVLGAGEWHTNFKLGADGEYLALVRPDGRTVVSEYRPAYPAQFPDISFGLASDQGVSEPRYFAPPTPGGPNGVGGVAVTLPPGIEPAGGTFADQLDVFLTATPASAEIRYTLDGSTPGAGSTLYTGPIRLTGTRQLRARAFVPGLVPSPVAGAAFSRLGATGRTFASDLPLVVINTFGRTVVDSARNPVYLAFRSPGSTGRTALIQPADFESRGAIEIRGSSSTGFEKKSYGFELQDEAGLDRRAGLLGMPADSDWVLYAPYTDKSLLRDVLAYELSNRIGRYAPRTRFVELFLNRGNTDLDAADYLGVYVLIEKVKIGPDRVAIAELEPDSLGDPEISGGYLLKRDRFDANDQVLTTGRGVELGIEDPKRSQIGTAQRNWIRTWLGQMETALYGTPWRDPVAGYRRFLEPDSFADHLLLVEAAKNIDGYRLSTFWHKDRGGRLVMGPLWDYNLTFGNANYLDGWLTNGWYYPNVGDPGFTWLGRLRQDADFIQLVGDRWFGHRAGPFANARVLALVDELAGQVREAQARNFQRWRILGTYVWPNWYIAPTWNDEIAWTKRWITNRFAWIDSQYLAPPRSSHPGGHVPDGAEVTLTASRGTLYYALDGTDPRLPGGGLASGVRTYTQPFRITTNARLVARARSGTVWSAPLDRTFVVQALSLAITELLFRPAGGRDDLEFVELRNTGTAAIALPGIRLEGAVQFVFPPTAGELLAGEHVVVARDRAAFVARYGPAPRVLGNFAGALPDDSGTLVLRGAYGEAILEFTYQADWYRTARDHGFSLTVANDSAPAPEWSTAAHWRPSLLAGGTPGRGNTLDRGAPRLLDAALEPDGIRLRFQAEPGVGYTLLASADLTSGSWVALRQVVPSGVGPFEIRDPLPPEAPTRFYRLVTPRQ